MGENSDDDDLLPLRVALDKYAVEDGGDWLADGREECRRLLKNEPEYHEVVREKSPYLYWGYEFTPEPPEEVAKELGLKT